MKTRQVTKLLAVVAFAASPVVADPPPRAPISNRAPAAQVRPDPWASTAVVHGARPVPAAPAATSAVTGLVELVTRPRTMPSGAPACGNVASRAPQPIDCGRGRP